MPKRNIIWIAAIMVVTVIAVYVARRREPKVVDATPAPLRPVVDTYRLIEEKYYGPLDHRKLKHKAIRGMVSALDEFSSYIPPEKLKSFNRRIAGMDRGVGLCLEMVEGKVMVVGLLWKSPAHIARIRVGDQVLAVDGQDVKGMALSEVELLLAGQVGSAVTLTVLRGRDERPVTVTRGEFPVDTVTGLYRDRGGKWVHYLADKTGIAYVRIKEFVRDEKNPGRNTGKRFGLICRQLGRPRGLVLDLRDNPGGYLEQAVPVADMFLTRGVIVTEVSGNDSRQVQRAHSEGTYHPVPLVVLINGRTASAAEIVAGALGHHGRAVLVGMRTRGKHCGQTMLPLSDGLGQINLTTSQFLVGTHRIAGSHDGGENCRVAPHVEVAMSEPELRELRRLWLGAAVMPTSAPATRPAKAVPPIARQIVKMDAQLSRAIKLLEVPREMEAILDKATSRVKLHSAPAKEDD